MAKGKPQSQFGRRATAQEMDDLRLQIRGDGKMIRAHMKVIGSNSVFIASMNQLLADAHPHLFEAFKEWCKVAMTSIIEETLGKGSVVDAVEKPPRYEQ